MPGHEFEITCPNEGNNAENEHTFLVEVEMTYGGSPGVWSLPEFSSPPEPPEFEWELPHECDECHHIFTDEERKKLEAEIEQQITDHDWTPDPPEPDYDDRY